MSGPRDGVVDLARRSPVIGPLLGEDDGVVLAQAAALAGLAWPGRSRWHLPRPVRRVARVALVVGATFGIAAGARHGTRLTPSVHPHTDGSLITDGLYAVSRNPIYAGLLVGGAGWAVLRRRPEPLLAWVALLTALVVKVRKEERHLHDRFGRRYADYRRRTPRFVGPVRD